MATPRIRCPYCGEQHDRAADVRACWERGAHAEVDPPPDHRVAHDVEAGRSRSQSGPVLAGPGALGRNLLLVGISEPLEPWRGAEVITLGEPAGDRLLDHVALAAHARRRMVFVADTDPIVPDEIERRPLWELDAGFRFERSWLHHFASIHSVVVTRERQHYPWAEQAIAAGCRPGTATDVVLPDGTPAWCDGGPLRWFDPSEVGGAVLHRVAIERGQVVPLGTNLTSAALADDQRAAVVEPAAVARIIAPAGSGKTRVLTERARHLLTAWRLPPDAMHLVAFNVRAAEEMRDRTTDLAGLQIRTLNSLALAIVNGTPPFEARRDGRRTIDEPEVRRLLESLVDLPRRANTDPAAAWLEALSIVRLGLRDPSSVEADYGGDVDGLRHVFPLYRSLLAERALVDFDEQIYRAVEILLTDPGAREAAERAGRALLVDEFQDLTPAHVLLLRLVAGPDGAVFGVGDDDQTIYGYSGASPSWLIEFGRYFPGAREHALTVNYRCPPTVVAAADRLLQRNHTRIAKEIHPAPDRVAAPGELVVLRGDERLDAVALTAQHVRSLLERGVRPDQIAVLGRVNAGLVPVHVALDEAGVPVQHRLDAHWATRTGVAAALAWLRIAQAPNRLDGDDVRQAARRPPRGISPRILDWMSEQSSIDGLRRLAGRITGRDAPKVAVLVDDIDRLVRRARSGADAAALLGIVRDELGLDRAMQSLEGARRRVDRSAQTDDLDALVALARLHGDLDSFESWLAEKLRGPSSSDGVVLATIHAVKGQEWPHVVVHDATAGVIPHRLADDREEERRVFHVAVTRGIETVTVVAGVPPSAFVRELTADPADDRPVAEPRLAGPASPRAGRVPVAASAGRSNRGARRREGATPEPGQAIKTSGFAGVVHDLSPEGVRVRVGDAVLLVAWGDLAELEGRTVELRRAEAGADAATVEWVRARLKDWRRERSQRERKPPYVYLSDAVLDAIARALPSNLTELRQIKGIGPAKTELYGDEILAAVAAGTPASSPSEQAAPPG